MWSNPCCRWAELFKYRDVSGDIRRIAFNAIDDNTTADDVLGFSVLIPLEYAFLYPEN